MKYNRELVHKSVKAMQKVEEVRFEVAHPGIALHSKYKLDIHQCLHRLSAHVKHKPAGLPDRMHPKVSSDIVHLRQAA